MLTPYALILLPFSLVSPVSLPPLLMMADTVGVAYRDLKRKRDVIASKIEQSGSELAMPYERC